MTTNQSVGEDPIVLIGIAGSDYDCVWYRRAILLLLLLLGLVFVF
jgi:hypothetical protein